MLLLHFNKYDESTDEYECGDIANIDVDGSADEGNLVMTVYTENGSWYVTFNEQDMTKLREKLK